MTDYIILLLEPLVLRLDFKTISRLSRTCKSLNGPFKNPLSIAEFFHWTVSGQLIKADKMLMENPKLALMTGTFTDWSDRIFKDFTGYQYALWAHDKDMQAVYKKYLTKEQAEIQKSALVNNPAKYEQHARSYDIRPLRLKMDKLNIEYHFWSFKHSQKYW